MKRILYLIINLSGVLCLAFSTKFDLFWWLGILMSIFTLIIGYKGSIRNETKIKEIDVNQKTINEVLNIEIDENNNVSSTFDCGEY